jgi:hypothetical protein
MEITEVVAGPIAFDEVDELIEALTKLKEAAVSLERGAVVYIRADEPFMNGNAHLEAETLSDDSVVYNVVIKPA